MAAPAVAAVASGNGTSAFTVTTPAGTVDGDLLIAVNASDWSTLAVNNVPAVFTTAGGGYSIVTSDYDNGTNAMHVALGARIAASEPASYTFPAGGTSDTVGAVLRVTGWDSAQSFANLIKEIASVALTAGTGAVSAPSIVPWSTDDLLLCFAVVDGANGGGALTYTAPTGMTEQVDRQSGNFTALSVASLQSPANPSGTKTFVTSPTNHEGGAACTISIKAAAAGGSVTGTIAGSLPALTSALSGSARVSGTAVGNLPALTASLTGAARVSGTEAGTLPSLTGSFAATARASGSLAGTLPTLTGSLAATVRVSASLDAALPGFTGNLSGVATATGSLTASLPALIASLTGDVSIPDGTVSGTFSASLPGMQGSIAGGLTATATVSGDLPALTAAATGTVKVSAAVAGQLPGLTAALTGATKVAASLAGSLQQLVVAFTGTTGPATEYTAPDEVTITVRSYLSTAVQRDHSPDATARPYISTATARSIE